MREDRVTTYSHHELFWRRVADATWGVLALGLGGWAIGWLLGVYTWVPGAHLFARVAWAVGAIETALLGNKASRDTLSERMRLAAERPLVPLLAGVLFYGGVTLAAHWPLNADQVNLLRAVCVITALGALCGHFYVRWFVGRTDPPMEEAFFAGGAYAIVFSLFALWGAPMSSSTAQWLFVATALSSGLLGARYFTLR